MTDSMEIDLLAHDYISDSDKRQDFINEFDQDTFGEVAAYLFEHCLREYKELPHDTQRMVFTMSEMMAKKDLGVDFKASDVTPF